MGGANTEASLVKVFEDFLIMCREARITLNPSKVRIGYEKQFFGLTIDKGEDRTCHTQHRPCQKHGLPQEPL